MSEDLGVLGEGSGGIVHLAKDGKRGIIAVKRCGTDPGTRGIPNEANLFLGLLGDYKVHHNVIQIFKKLAYIGETHIHMEFCDGGDLRTLLERLIDQRTFAYPSFVRHLQVHIAAALLFIHKGVWYSPKKRNFHNLDNWNLWNGIIHRDIKPDNMFFRLSRKIDNTSPYPDIVLADFGSAITERPYISQYHGRIPVEVIDRNSEFTDFNYSPPKYITASSPEMRIALSINPSFGIYQFGAVLYELLTHKILTKQADPAIDCVKWGGVAHDAAYMCQNMPAARMSDAELCKGIQEWQSKRDLRLEAEDGGFGRFAFGD